MKKSEVVLAFLLTAVVFGWLFNWEYKERDNELHVGKTQAVSACDLVEEDGVLLTIKYMSLDVPNIDNSFKTWMSYKAVKDKNSPQYKFINTYGWSDVEGFMRCYSERELGIEQDYYMIALGSYYGTEIGTKYRITLDTGEVFYGVLADCKDDKHTNSTNQYIPHNGNVVEFLVEKTKLNSNVRKTGNAGAYAPLKGNIIKIEKIIF